MSSSASRNVSQRRKPPSKHKYMWPVLDRYGRDGPPSPVHRRSSDFTILGIQDSISSGMPSIFMGAPPLIDTRSEKRNRIHFFFTILTYCLGLGNLWRFPRQVIMHGNATFIYLYVIYSLVLGVPLLFFEVGVGQYWSNKGFAKIFAICPLLEGITTSIFFYCLVANIFYNTINVYALHYIYSVFSAEMEHSGCLVVNNKTDLCRLGVQHQNLTMEYQYFRNHVLDRDANFNVRNCGVLIVIWIVICLVIIFDLVKRFWTPIILSIVIITTLIFTTIVSFTLKGSLKGTKEMFVPWKNDLKQISTWTLPFEQSIVTFGLGMGPTLIFWTTTKYKQWTNADTLIVSLCAFFCTLLIGVIAFNAAGVVANDITNASARDVFRPGQSGVQMHVIFPQLFNKLPKGFSHFMIFVFYTMVLLSGIYSTVTYSRVIFIYIRTYVTPKKVRRPPLVITVCVIQMLLGTMMASSFGTRLMGAFDKMFIGISPVLILCFELIAIMYMFGIGNFCDDLEFMLGFVPNYYYQLAWIFSPLIFLAYGLLHFINIWKMASSMYDRAVGYLVIVLIFLPVGGWALFQIVRAIRSKKLLKVFNPRFDEDLISTRSDFSSRTNRPGGDIY